MDLLYWDKDLHEALSVEDAAADIRWFVDVPRKAGRLELVQTVAKLAEIAKASDCDMQLQTVRENNVPNHANWGAVQLRCMM